MKKLKFPEKVLLTINVVAALALGASYFAPHVSPATFWPLAFLGLGYPFIVLTNVLFLIYWVARRKIHFLLPAIALVAGWSHLTSLVQFNAKEMDSLPSGGLKVMSFNVRLFDLYDWTQNEDTRNRIFDLLERENPDVICFQEYFHCDCGDPDFQFPTTDSLVQLLDANHTHLAYHYEGKDPYRPKNTYQIGMALYSRFPIVNKGQRDFPGHNNNLATFTDLAIGNDTVRFFNAHLASINFDKEDRDIVTVLSSDDPESGTKRVARRLKDAFVKRADQAEQIAQMVDESPHPVVLCGDFNDVSTSYAYRTLTRNLQDAFASSGSGLGSTYNGKLPGFRIDFILYDREVFDSYEFETIREDVSDHYPIVTRLAFREK